MSHQNSLADERIRLVSAVLVDHFCGDGEELLPLDPVEAEGLAQKILAVLAEGRFEPEA